MTFPYTNASSGAGSTIWIGRAFGIDLRMQRLFPWMMAFLVVIYAGQAGPGQLPLALLSSAIGLSLIFGLVILHELGHALVARHFGIRVLDIVLWPLGGMARMEEIPENSRVEGLVAIAGPLVNLALASLGIVVGTLLIGLDVLGGVSLDAQGLSKYVGWFVVVNLMLGLFNLIPAFPMDGGRLLRAWLGRKGDYLRATEQAVRVGRVSAWIMILAAFPTGIWALLLIGPYVLYAGARELLMMRLRHGVAPFGGATFGWPGGTVQWPGGAREQDSEPAGTPAEPNTAGDATEGGFSDADVKRLERYHGRLKRSEPD